MEFQEIKNICLEKPGAYECCPFGPFPICYKVGNRIFLEWYPKEEMITVRCEPMLGDHYKQHYPGIVVPGYHCPDRQRRFKITVYLNQGIEDTVIPDMIDHSFQEAAKRAGQNSKKTC